MTPMTTQLQPALEAEVTGDRDEPLISAVVIARNEEHTIVACLEAVRKAIASVGGSDILLVDSGSTDRTAQLAVRWGFRTLVMRKASRFCPSAARWIGAARTRSRYLLFLDGDCQLHPAFLSAAVRAMESDAGLGIVSGFRTDLYKTPKGVVATQGEYYERQRDGTKVQARHGGCALYRRAALEKAGSFNPFLRALEEEELSGRIEAMGFRPLVLPIPMIQHVTVPRESVRRLLRSLHHGFYIGRGQAARLLFDRRRVRAAFKGLSRVSLTVVNAVLGCASLVPLLLYGNYWPMLLWACISAAGFCAFAWRSRSLWRPTYYFLEWLIQGACLIVGFFVRTPSAEMFRWEGEMMDPSATLDCPLPRVLLVGPCPPPPLRGGVERGVDLLLRSPLSRRTSMKVFNSYRKRDPDRKLWERLIYQWRKVSDLRKELAGQTCDVVHVKTSSGINFFQNSLYALSARVAGIPVVLQIHCGKFLAFYQSSSWLLRAWIRHTLSKVFRVVVLSDLWADRIAAIAPGARLAVVPNGLDSQDLELLGVPERHQGPQVLFMGTGDIELNREKGLEDLLAVVPALADKYPSCRWVLAGLPNAEEVAGRLRSSRSGSAEESEQIRCLGVVDGQDKLALLRSCSILVLPSQFENMPNIVLEAMAAGMAVVSTDVGAVPEMLGHGEGGFLTSVGDPDSLREGLDHLLDSPSLVQAQGRRNREVVVRDYSMEVVQKRLGRLYLETAGWRVPVGEMETGRSAVADWGLGRALPVEASPTVES